MENDCFTYRGGLYCRVSEPECPPAVRVGLLLNKTYGPLPLFGRRTDRHSAEWFYHTESSTDPPQTLPVIDKRGRSCRVRPYSRGCIELNDGDEVSVQGYPDEIFKVSLFQN